MSKEDFNIREAGINTYMKMVEEHDKQYREQVMKEWSEIATLAYKNVEKERVNKMTVEEAIYQICKTTEESKMVIANALKSVLKRIESQDK